MLHLGGRLPLWTGTCRLILGCALLCALASFGGCSRRDYRLWADRDAYRIVDRASRDPRWNLQGYTISVDPRSRFYDPYRPDKPPMPPDDPTSHRLMHWVDGKTGYRRWHWHGDTPYVENPAWEYALPCNAAGVVVLDLDTAVELALRNSRNYQQNLEELYLSALDVSFERFRLDTQFFGGNDTFITSDGRRRRGNPRGGNRSSTVFNTDTTLQMRKSLAAGGEFVAGFANTFMWQLAGSNDYSANSLLNFTFVQPFLRSGGKERFMERLTTAERTLLANVRAMERYRQEFFVDIETGRNAGQGPSRRGGFFGGAGLEGFTGIGVGGFGAVGQARAGGGGAGGAAGAGAGAQAAGGFIGLLQARQEIKNQELNIRELCNSLDLLQKFNQRQALAEPADPIARLQQRIQRPLQEQQTKQRLYEAQSRLEISEAQYEQRLDQFKGTLGLPPDLPIEIRGTMLEQFDLLRTELLTVRAAAQSLGGRMNEIVEPEDQAWLEQQSAAVKPFEAELPAELLAPLNQRLRELASFPAALETAPQLQAQALRRVPLLREAVRDMERNRAQRRRSLERLSETNDVHQCAVLGNPFDVTAFENRVERALENYARILDVLGKGAPQLPDTQVPAPPNDETCPPEGAAAADVADIPEETVQMLLARWEELRRKALQARQTAESRLANVKDDPNRVAAVTALSRELEATLRPIRAELEQLEQAARDMVGVYARARLESIVLVPVEMVFAEAMNIARENRLDWMNARAALVDTWRLIEFNANDLEADFDLVFEGDIATTDDNPFRFRDTTGRLRVGFQFDAPLAKLGERNIYRQSLIEYQQARRSYMAFVDGVAASLRNILRTIELNKVNFELRRAAVDVAVEKFRLTELGTTLGASSARDAIDAIADLQTVQNDFMSFWVSYELQRRFLDLDLGTFQLDDRGMWIDPGESIGRIHGPIGACPLWEDAGQPGSEAGEGVEEISPGQPDGRPELPMPPNVTRNRIRRTGPLERVEGDERPSETIEDEVADNRGQSFKLVRRQGPLRAVGRDIANEAAVDTAGRAADDRPRPSAGQHASAEDDTDSFLHKRVREAEPSTRRKVIPVSRR
jgi:hypothetical protein